MSARRAPIIKHNKFYMMAQVTPEDFECGPWTSVDPQEVLKDATYSLYCLDSGKREALFVKTPPDKDLTDAPFIYLSQYQFATELLAMDFDDFHRLASRIPLNEESILFIHSVGRCGSTLLSKVFQALPNTCSLSEPDTFTQLTQWRCTNELPSQELQGLCDSSVRFCCKPMPGKSQNDLFVIKFRAQCIEIADWMFNGFPQSKKVFIHREPLSWLRSAYRAFINDDALNDKGFPAFFEEIMAEFFPQIRDTKHPGYPMSLAQTWMLVWICVMEARKRTLNSGIEWDEYHYEDIRKAPEPCLQRLFDHCGIHIENWAPIHACLKQDSQKGTLVAQDKVRTENKEIPQTGLRQAEAMLKQWGYFDVCLG